MLSKLKLSIVTLMLVSLIGCSQAIANQQEDTSFQSAFTSTHDRIWAGGEYWANPMENWEIKDGQLHCTSRGANRNFHILTRMIGDKPGTLSTSVSFKTTKEGPNASVGFRLGAKAEIQDYRAWALRGRGVDCGLLAGKQLFIGNKKIDTDHKIIASGILTLNTTPNEKGGNDVTLTLKSPDGQRVIKSLTVQLSNKQLHGSIALVNNHNNYKGFNGGMFSFSDWKITGTKLERHDERSFGPILWSMQTLSRGVLKLTAQMPPVGAKDNQKVQLELMKNKKWVQVAEVPIDPDARTARFKIDDWNDKVTHEYRLKYVERDKNNKTQTHYYTGEVRHDPVDRTLKVAGFTGNTDYVFPNNPVVENVTKQDPDMLFFSGDQLYEQVGGYGIIRKPADRSIINYLRKWYLFGWSFGDLMRDRPSVILPDDHDVYQGNIWGAGGVDPNGMANHSKGGYAQPAQMVNAVHRTQTSHHPKLYDPTPIARDISVYYGDMVYGRVSFAIISDRMFKDGPEGKVNTWKGRPDHIASPMIDIEALDKPGLKLLGDRQIKFLREWTTDWRGADMKVLLSQTIFCNLANYHGGNQMYLIADLDSNGWPQSGRNLALDVLRRGFTFHYAGDQHLASIVHHGIDEHADAIYSFCVPSIAAGYPRSWRPDAEGRSVANRQLTKLPNTGDYIDGLKNKVRVWAIGNPEKKYRKGLLNIAHDKTSGYGMAHFNKDKRTIKMECWKYLIDVNNPKPEDQHPGWPKTISMYDNYARDAKAYLPTVKSDIANPVIQVVNQMTNEIEYTVRIKGKSYAPKVFMKDAKYTVKLGTPENGKWQTVTDLTPGAKDASSLNLKLK